jgi:hypothetical protein
MHALATADKPPDARMGTAGLLMVPFGAVIHHLPVLDGGAAPKATARFC